MNEERLSANVVKNLLDNSARHISPHIQNQLNLAIAKSVQVHAEKYGNHINSQKNRSWGNYLQDIATYFGRPVWSMAISTVFIASAILGVAQFGLENYDAYVSETADLDAAILSDDLPTDAYLDSGFINYAKELQKINSTQSEDSIDNWKDSLPSDFTTSI
jgi:hypothetical protein